LNDQNMKNPRGKPARHIVALRNNVINMSWELLEKALSDEKVSMNKKIDIAKSICVKSIPNEVEVTSEAYNQVLDELAGNDLETIRGIVNHLRESANKG